jgi:hypothetical protein
MSEVPVSTLAAAIDEPGILEVKDLVSDLARHLAHSEHHL